jgi:hypothetical protein
VPANTNLKGIRVTLIVRVPTVPAKEPDPDRLWSLWTETTSESTGRIEFDFKACTFLSATGVAFFGGLILLLRNRGSQVTFRWDTLRGYLERQFKKNGLLATFRGDALQLSGNAIPFRHVLHESPDLLKFLRENWMGRDHVHVSEKLANEICGKVWEIVNNCFQHAKSPVGITVCGQYYPVGKRLSLTIVDWGVGIPATIRTHFEGTPQDRWSARECMEWAFDAPGNTTAIGKISRGLGLKLLREFVALCGTMEVFSHDGHSQISQGKEEIHRTIPHCFTGTMVTLDLACDERRFVLASEVASDPIF